MDVSAWRELLQGDCDSVFLLNGIAEGFHIVEDNNIYTPVEINNYVSKNNCRAMEKQIFN